MKLDQSYKVRVNPEQSREIQELLFSVGFRWAMSGQTVHPDREIILIESDKLRLLNGAKSTLKFYIEIPADDLIAMLTDMSKPEPEIDTSANSVDNLADNANILVDNKSSLVHSDDNYQAPHVSSPSNDDATHVSEPCNDALFPRFEAGQKAYCPWLNDGGLVTLGLDDNGDLIAQTKKGWQAFDCEGYALDCTPRQPDLFPATDYYFEHLSAIMPWIDFEAPPKELKGSDLAKALIKKGWCGFNCVCGNSGDDNVMITTIVTSINGSGQFIDIDGRFFNNAVPMLGCYPLKPEQVGL